MKEHWTTRGRVVYDRKFHAFNQRDLLRIARKIDSKIVSIYGISSGDILAKIAEYVATVGSASFVYGTSDDFSGGSFGGAGASRGFNKASTGTVVILYFEGGE